MSAIGQVVRSVSIPAFARLASGRSDQSLATVVGPVWAVSLLAGLMLAVLSAPVVELVYGEKWLPAAVILGWLGLFGSLRTLFDLSASYLLARGASKATLIVQVAWIAALVPAVFSGVGIAGTAGAAIAHLGTALLIVCPAYAFALRSSGANLLAIGSRLWPPVAAAIPAAGAALGAMALQPTPLASLFAGGAAGTGVYALLLAKWFRRQVREAVRWMPGSDLRTNTESNADQRSAAQSGGTP